MKATISNIIGLCMTGVLSLLWFDIRTVRIRREKDKEGLEEKYLSKEVHVIMCDVAQLRMKEIFTDALKLAVTEIKIEIKKNGSREG